MQMIDEAREHYRDGGRGTEKPSVADIKDALETVMLQYGLWVGEMSGE